MKWNIAIGIFLIGAMALSSCSTTKLANTERSDDVYFSKAKAGDEPTYAAVDNQNPNATQEQAYSDDDDDYCTPCGRCHKPGDMKFNVRLCNHCGKKKRSVIHIDILPRN